MTDESHSCPAEELLLDYVAKRLDESTRQRVQEHLDACHQCSESVAWMSQNLLKEITDEFEEESQATEGLAGEESVGADTEAWAGVDDGEFDVRQFSPSPNKNALGRLGKYDILGVLGRGGMGIVFKAFDEQLRRTVAIKVLNRRLSNSDTARRRFIREARAAAGINHHNVVTIHAVEEHEHCPFLVMEYVDGGSLREHIRKNGTLEPLEVVRLSREIASGLAAAHAQGVIHRDIKPGNIMLEDGAVRVKIGDFGLARVAVDNVELTSRELAVGTPTYMSPEQVKGKKVDLRSDLFSLGCVMYAMIAGQSPFRGQHALEVAHKVAEVTPQPLEKTIEGTPTMLSDMVAKLLEKEPDDRYQSATEVAEVLGRYLAVLNETPTDEMSAVLQGHRPHSETRRAPARWILVVCALALVAGLVSWPFWWPGRDAPGPTRDSSNGTKVPGTANSTTEHPEFVTVGQSVDADARSINQALEQANQCIRVGPPMDVAQGAVAQDVRIERNIIRGRLVQVLLSAKNAPFGRTVVLGNRFLGSENGRAVSGINMSLDQEFAQEPNIRIYNNTFWNTGQWIGLAFTEDYRGKVMVCNNLILGCDSIAGTPERLQNALTNWQFQKNFWEKNPITSDDEELYGRIATLEQEINLVERDNVDHKDFLRPCDSRLTSGFVDDAVDHIWPYVGAVEPMGPDAD